MSNKKIKISITLPEILEDKFGDEIVVYLDKKIALSLNGGDIIYFKDENKGVEGEATVKFKWVHTDTNEVVIEANLNGELFNFTKFKK
jgi:hypothetical protein